MIKGDERYTTDMLRIDAGEISPARPLGHTISTPNVNLPSTPVTQVATEVESDTPVITVTKTPVDGDGNIVHCDIKHASADTITEVPATRSTTVKNPAVRVTEAQ